MTTLDTLRPPQKRGQPIWEWRRDQPIRPVVFSDPGSLDAQTVHLHLEHRFEKDELKQLQAAKRYWDRRLVARANESETEPARIRQSYEVKASRFEPVGLVYLWPVTG